MASWSRVSALDGLPDELSDVHHQVGRISCRRSRRPNLARTHTDHVVEAGVASIVAEMKDRTDDLSAARGVGATVAVTLEHDHGAVVGLDHGSEVGTERPLDSPAQG